MDSEELISRYKLMPMAARLLIALLLGIIPAYYIYLEDGDELEKQMNDVKEKLSTLEGKFEKERAKRNKLPELEAKLAFTEQQLKESSKRLPETFLMNDILQEASTIARDVGVELQVFDPGTPEPAGDAFKYMEMPIELVISGKYTQIANFYDRLANLEKMVHVRNIRLVPMPIDNRNPFAAPAVPKSEENLSGAQRTSRADFRIQASAAMVIYRGMTAAEESKIASLVPVAKPGAAAAPAAPGGDGKPAAAPPPAKPPRSGKDDDVGFSLPPITGKIAEATIESNEKM